MKPLIIYVSGAPGSGKTTLAKLISEQLYIPLISSDLIHGGVALSNSGHDRRKTLQHIFVPLLVHMAEQGISFTVDHVLQKGLSETTIIDQLRPLARIIYVHTQTNKPIERYISRVTTSATSSIIERREHLLRLAADHQRNLNRTNDPLRLEVPTLLVKTDNGYEPSLDDIISFIKQSA